MKASLKIYRTRRGLKKEKKAAEPYGKIKKSKAKEPKYVVQKHDASHLHYDLRLEINGVLKSWAVPKGLPDKPGIRRLAMPTDDHPMEYGNFEGIIPEGYGAGTVMLWDHGTYTNLKTEKGKPIPMIKCYDQGKIEIFIKGKKVWGPYALIKTKSLQDKESWLFMRMRPKEEFDFKRPVGKKINKEHSVVSGRTLKQIEKEANAQWNNEAD